MVLAPFEIAKDEFMIDMMNPADLLSQLMLTPGRHTIIQQSDSNPTSDW